MEYADRVRRKWKCGFSSQLAERGTQEPCRPTMSGGCLYKVRAHSQDSQESAMRGKGNRILIPSPCIVSKTVVDWLSVTR